MAVPIVDSANRSWPTNDVSDCGRVLRSGSARLVDITVQGRKPLTVKRASGRALQTSISSCPTVIVPPLYGKLPELSGRWRSFQLTFMSCSLRYEPFEFRE